MSNTETPACRLTGNCTAASTVTDSKPLYPRIGCVIMASGEGKRFGGNKLMADFGGEPLLCAILRTVEGFFGERVVVTRHADVAALCAGKGIPVMLHDKPYRSDTVRIGLETMLHCAGVVFCPGDQPLLTRQTMIRLADAFMQDDGHIWRAVHDGTPGAPVLFPSSFFQELLQLPQGKGGGAVMRAHPEDVRCIQTDSALELEDVDTPEDLLRLAKAAKKDPDRA